MTSTPRSSNHNPIHVEKAWAKRIEKAGSQPKEGKQGLPVSKKAKRAVAALKTKVLLDTVVTFGAHVGKTAFQAGPDYLEWVYDTHAAHPDGDGYQEDGGPSAVNRLALALFRPRNMFRDGSVTFDQSFATESSSSQSSSSGSTSPFHISSQEARDLSAMELPSGTAAASTGSSESSGSSGRSTSPFHMTPEWMAELRAMQMP